MEDFLQFVPVTDATERGIAAKIIETLEQVGVGLKYSRAQGYDGAKAMSRELCGVQTVSTKTYTLVLYMNCSLQVLYLAITDASSFQVISNCMGVVGNICAFYRFSGWLNVLKESIEKPPQIVAKLG